MKKLPILLAGLVLLCAGAAFAQSGNNLAWNDCVGSGREVFDRTDACTNSGIRNLIASFVSPSDIADLGGCEWVMELQTNASTLDPWWTGNENFGTRWSYDKDNPTAALCEGDVWGTAATIAVPATFKLRSAAGIRLYGAQAFIAPSVGQVTAGVNYYNFTLQLKYSDGTLDNAGCLAAACLVLHYCDLQTANYHVPLDYPATRYYVTWRESTGVRCPDFVPISKSTWGSIKSKYR